MGIVDIVDTPNLRDITGRPPLGKESRQFFWSAEPVLVAGHVKGEISLPYVVIERLEIRRLSLVQSESGSFCSAIPC